MTDAETVKLAREVMVQFFQEELSEHEAWTAMALVLDPGLYTYEEVAMRVRTKTAHLGT